MLQNFMKNYLKRRNNNNKKKNNFQLNKIMRYLHQIQNFSKIFMMISKIFLFLTILNLKFFHQKHYFKSIKVHAILELKLIQSNLKIF